MAVSVIPKNSNIELLWTNSDPASAFTSQTISLDLNVYNCVFIVFRQTTSSSANSSLMVIPNGYDYIAFSPLAAGTEMYKRILTPRRTGIQFYVGRSDNTEDNTKMVPRFIYGIRF